jgi:osmotically-inducible protein OsmY
MAVATAPQQLSSIVSMCQQHEDLPSIQIAIKDALDRAGYGEFRCVDLQCVGGTIIISGRVPTYYLKQLVQNIALSAPGVERVNNQLQVC